MSWQDKLEKDIKQLTKKVESCDEEIKKLEYEIEGLKSVKKVNIEIMREYKRMANIRNKEIKDLHESCNNYKQMYVREMEEIKKLRDALEDIGAVTYATTQLKESQISKIELIIKKALKDGE